MAITSTDANIFISAMPYSAKIHSPCLYGLYAKAKKHDMGEKWEHTETYSFLLRSVKIKKNRWHLDQILWITEFVANFSSILVILKHYFEGDTKIIPCIEGKM